MKLSRAKVRLVALREFVAAVRRPSYLILTLGMPLFAGLWFLVAAAVPALFLEQRSRQAKVVGVVDLTPERLVRFGDGPETLAELPGELRRVLEAAGRASPSARGALELAVSGNVSFVRYPGEAEALEALRAGRLRRYYVVPPDYLATGALRAVLGRESVFTGGAGIGGRFRDWMRESLLVRASADERLRERLRRPVDSERLEVLSLREDGSLGPHAPTERIARMVVPGVFALLLLVALMFTSGYLLHGVAEEKENRVLEILLSSLRPDELLLGKLLGLGAAGLLQLLVWSSVVLLAGLGTALAAGAEPGLVALCLPLFLLGYLMLGTLMTGTGALGGGPRESQQLASLWSLITVLPPAATWMILVDQPHGPLARALSWFPLTSPVTLMLRLGAGGPPWRADGVPLWDLGLAVAAMMAGAWVALRLGARLFRAGVLMTGKRPSPRVLLRVLRSAS